MLNKRAPSFGYGDKIDIAVYYLINLGRSQCPHLINIPSHLTFKKVQNLVLLLDLVEMIASRSPFSIKLIIQGRDNTTLAEKSKTLKTLQWVQSSNSHQFGHKILHLVLERVCWIWFRWDRKGWFKWSLPDIQVQIQELL